MTQEEKFIEILEAFREGKEIEFKPRNTTTQWCKILDKSPMWNFSNFDYRIRDTKLESYRPYNSTQEIMEDYKKHGPFIINKVDNISTTNISITDLDSNLSIVINVDFEFTSEGFLSDCTWGDGAVCGVLKEEDDEED